MFEGINSVAQIIISATILIVAIAFVLIAYKKGLKIGYKQNSVQFGDGKNAGAAVLYIEDLEIIIDIIIKSVKEISELNKAKKLQLKMDYAQEKVIVIRGQKEIRYHDLLKSKNVPEDELTSHPDFQYFLQVLGNACYYDNGTQSIVSMVRKQLRTQSYQAIENVSDNENRTRYKEFIDAFTETVQLRWKRFFYENYKTKISDYEGKIRDRVITIEDLNESDTETDHVNMMKEIFMDIFDNARDIDEQVKIEEVKLNKDRERQIKAIINLRHGKEKE